MSINLKVGGNWRYAESVRKLAAGATLAPSTLARISRPGENEIAFRIGPDVLVASGHALRLDYVMPGDRVKYVNPEGKTLKGKVVAKFESPDSPLAAYRPPSPPANEEQPVSAVGLRIMGW